MGMHHLTKHLTNHSGNVSSRESGSGKQVNQIFKNMQSWVSN